MSKGFLRTNSFCLNNNHHTARYVLILFPLYKWGYWGTEKLRNIPKVTQLRNDRAGIQAFALKGLCSEAGVITQHSHPSPTLSFSGAHNSPPAVTLLSGQYHLQPVFPPRLDQRLGGGESAALWQERESEVCAPPEQSCILVFRSWKYQHTNHLFYLFKHLKN